jgi:hypothetical protein
MRKKKTQESAQKKQPPGAPAAVIMHNAPNDWETTGAAQS